MRERREGATSARIAIEFSLGRATVRALDADSPNLLEAELTYVGDIEFDVTGEAERVIKCGRRQARRALWRRY